jgi:hypothetical protein
VFTTPRVGVPIRETSGEMRMTGRENGRLAETRRRILMKDSDGSFHQGIARGPVRSFGVDSYDTG